MFNNYRLKAYKDLLQRKKFSLIWKIRKDLQEIKFSNSISQDYDRELSIRQYFLFLFGQIRLDRALLFSLGSKKNIRFFPLHPLHVKCLKNNGIKVSLIWTFIAFFSVNLIINIKAIFFFVKLIFESTHKKNIFKGSKDFLFFMDLSSRNLPQPYEDGVSYDVISWFINWGKHDTKFIFHSALKSNPVINYKGKQIKFAPSFLPQIINRKLFFKKGLSLIFSSLSNLFKFKLGCSLMIYEDLKSLIFKIAESDQIAKEYIFPFSTNFYRPVWTYEAEKRGSKIILYNYSGGKPVNPINSNQSLFSYEGLLNWPKILVWDKYYLNMIKDELKNVNEIKVVGPIDFATSSKDIPNTNTYKIAVFGTPPINIKNFPLTASNEIGLTNPKVQSQFIKDILDVTKKTSSTIFIKPKRRTTFKYKTNDFLDELSSISRKGNVMVLDPDISAKRLIEKSDITISFPFTSTSLIAKFLSKKTIYYDPTGLISKNDNGNSGVLLISRKNELKKWFKSHLLSNQ